MDHTARRGGGARHLRSHTGDRRRRESRTARDCLSASPHRATRPTHSRRAKARGHRQPHRTGLLFETTLFVLKYVYRTVLELPIVQISRWIKACLCDCEYCIGISIRSLAALTF